jgi:hypothetical protein
MTIPKLIYWPGKSGNSYRYFIYNIGTNFKAVSGNYIFVKASSGSRSAIYIGQTDDLCEDFENHPKMSCIREHGANQIHVRINKEFEDARKKEVADLIDAQNPPCNKEVEPEEEQDQSSNEEAEPVEEHNPPISDNKLDNLPRRGVSK